MLNRLSTVLVTLLVVCALGLVTSQHRARTAFVDVERAQAHANAHEVRWNQLQVEQTELSKAARVDLRARRELAMQAIEPERTLHLSVDPVTRHVSLSQPWKEVASTKPGAAAGARTTPPRASVPRAPVPASVRTVANEARGARRSAASEVRR